MRYVAEALTDIGKKRSDNEDTFLIDNGANLFAVADGMGGMEKGKLASSFALKTVPDLLRRKDLRPGEIPIEISSSLRGVLFKLSQLVRSEVGELSGTTLVMALGLGDHMYIASISDSRAYLQRDGNHQRLTKDHNMASLLIDAGRITPEEAMHHPARSLLTMYLGIESSCRG